VGDSERRPTSFLLSIDVSPERTVQLFFSMQNVGGVWEGSFNEAQQRQANTAARYELRPEHENDFELLYAAMHSYIMGLFPTAPDSLGKYFKKFLAAE
jgi:hypothetical protein